MNTEKTILDNNTESSLEEFITRNIGNKDFVFQNLDKFPPTALVHWYVDDEMFTEEFILVNIKYFNEVIEMIVKRKKILTDTFFKAICTKSNYSRFKTTRRLFEPFRDFTQLDAILY